MPESSDLTASMDAITLTGDLHARPAASLAIAAAKFQSSIELVAGAALIAILATATEVGA